MLPILFFYFEMVIINTLLITAICLAISLLPKKMLVNIPDRIVGNKFSTSLLRLHAATNLINTRIWNGVQTVSIIYHFAIFTPNGKIYCMNGGNYYGDEDKHQ